MKNSGNIAGTGFRFPDNLFARIFVADLIDGTVVRIRLLREAEKTTIQLDILKEAASGINELMARRYIPCVVDDDSYLVSIDKRFNKPVRFRTVSAAFRINEDGLIELQITHQEDGKTIVDRFSA